MSSTKGARQRREQQQDRETDSETDEQTMGPNRPKRKKRKPHTPHMEMDTVVWLFGGLFALTLITVLLDPRLREWVFGKTKEPVSKSLQWWQTTIIYQVYPRSFQDSDGDGIGDLKGIQDRLSYFQDLGVEAVWLSPFYKSPMVDFGYDISDFTDVDPMFGTIADFDNLITEAHIRGINIIMDFVPNHTSDKHPWFQESRKGGATNKYKDYYVWHEGNLSPDGTRVPPNNWVGAFGGSMWEWDEQRQAFYLHQFTKEQPDLNFRNPKVHQEILNAYRFWLDKGVDGFRVDAIRHMYEVANVSQDEPRSFVEGTTPDQYEYYDHIHTVSQPEVHPVLTRWRRLFEEYEKKRGKRIFMVVEVFDAMKNALAYYDSGADFPFNFNLQFANKSCDGFCYRRLVGSLMDHIPPGKWPNWVTGSHDVGRVSAKVGGSLVNAFNFLLLLLPGTPTTYYGEELGMQAIQVSYEDTQDPFGINFGQERYTEFSRDPCRSPMQWSRDKNAGFSTAQKPWLPVHPDFKTRNVETQKVDPTGFSPLQIYKELAKLRKQESFLSGKFDYAIVNTNIFSFIRYTKDEPSYLIALNIGQASSADDYTTYHGTFGGKGKFVPKKGHVILTTGKLNSGVTQGNTISLDKVVLSPGEGIVVRFTPA